MSTSHLKSTKTKYFQVFGLLSKSVRVQEKERYQEWYQMFEFCHKTSLEEGSVLHTQEVRFHSVCPSKGSTPAHLRQSPSRETKTGLPVSGGRS